MQRVMAKLACISKAFKGHSSTLSAPLAAAGPVYLRPCTRYTLISRTATSLRTLSNAGTANVFSRFILACPQQGSCASLQGGTYLGCLADLPQQLCSTSSSGHSVRCQSSQNPQQIQQASQSTTDSLTGPPQAYCSGCGVKFQQDDPDLPGYLFSVFSCDCKLQFHTCSHSSTIEESRDSVMSFSCTVQVLQSPKAKGAGSKGTITCY